jgi:Ca2+:H+ antiporter
MIALLNEIRHNPLLWLLFFVPVVFIVGRAQPEAHTMLFLLSVLAIVPLAALLSRATEFVATKTGDAVGGLLNATLGNLTELIIALAALRAGETMLVKASIAGAIVTNTLFMLGASFFIGGLKYHLQEYNRISARLQAGLLFLATIALVVPSAVAQADSSVGAAFTNKLSVGLAVLLIVAYGLGMLFSLKTHRELFGSVAHEEEGEEPWPMGLALATLACVTVLLLSYLIGPGPMDLRFWPGAVVMMLIATVTASLVTNSGRSAWFVGALVLMVYLIFAMTLYLLPPRAS